MKSIIIVGLFILTCTKALYANVEEIIELTQKPDEISEDVFFPKKCSFTIEDSENTILKIKADSDINNLKDIPHNIPVVLNEMKVSAWGEDFQNNVYVEENEAEILIEVESFSKIIKKKFFSKKISIVKHFARVVINKQLSKVAEIFATKMRLKSVNGNWAHIDDISCSGFRK